ncbi:MAG: HAMP domain-containing histidine kinase [Planctomycetales bacterium]|nr:HAMP domain-containing histidine kinase [Planctomycetales bacterium]
MIQLPKHRYAGIALLALVWVGFAFWQRTEHVHQCRLIYDALSSRGDVLARSVRSGIQSHRWFGPFVQQQLPSTLDALVGSGSAIAIAVVVNDDFEHPYFAGDMGQVAFHLGDGEHVRGTTLQIVNQFTLDKDPPFGGSESAGVVGTDTDHFRSYVVLDRTATTKQSRQEAENRVLIVVLGTLLLGAAAAVWQFTIRLAKSEGQTRLLTAETRHLRELGQAAAGLAHETRNPLGLIRGWTQRMVDTGLASDEHQEQAEAVLEECDRVTARINQFLAFARQADVVIESVAMKELIDDLRTLLQPDLDGKSLTFTTDESVSRATVLADREQFRQILFNLLQNAIAFAPERSTITVLLPKSTREQYRLEIVDQGPGASEEIVDSLFEPYVTARPGGTGLGLSIVRRIASAHGWTVGYRRGNEGGSVFWIDGIRQAL